MNLYGWVGLLLILIFAWIPQFSANNRTKKERKKAVFTTIIVLAMIVGVMFFHLNFIIVVILGFIAMLLVDEKTYTKKRLIIFTVVGVALVSIFIIVLREQPSYVVKYLEKHPETTSLYIAHNDEVIVEYEADIIRPLASTVKIAIALEYAMQVEERKLTQDQFVSLDELEKFYIKDTDGDAHPDWLRAMELDEVITNGQVPLHEIVKGMITYSSNANTELLIRLLGAHNINERLKQFGLMKHEQVYPIVGALYVAQAVKTGQMSNQELVKTLEEMPMSTYIDYATNESNRLAAGEKLVPSHLTIDVQRVWSNRLIGSTAKEYGHLLALLGRNQLPPKASEVMRDIMEWPMQKNALNKMHYHHLGMKGGSTLFVLTNAVYAETIEGDLTEVVLLTDDLSRWDAFLLTRNLNSFISEVIQNEEFRKKVQTKLRQS